MAKSSPTAEGYRSIPLPLGGMVRRGAYQSQPPGTTPNCNNVRPADALLERDRIGSRPGLSTMGQPSANAVQFIGDIGYIKSNALLTAAIVVTKSGNVFSDRGVHTIGGGFTQCGAPTAAGLNTTFSRIGGVDLNQKYYLSPRASDGGIVIYDPVAETITIAPTWVSTPPTYCLVLANYRGRLVAAYDVSGTGDPNEVYFSKQNNPLNWDYTATGPGAAIRLSDGLAGKMGEPVRALAVGSNNRMFIGCVGSLWMLDGDPQAGGRLSCLTSQAGIIDPAAWTFLPDKSLLFMAFGGLWLQRGNKCEPISPRYLPQELKYLDSSSWKVSVAYDPWHEGVHILASGSSNIGYFATRRGEKWSFWPTDYASGTGLGNPTYAWAIRSFTAPSATNRNSLVYIGDSSGYVSIFDYSVACAAASYVDVPIPLAGEDGCGQLDALEAIIGAGSNTLTAAVRCGLSAEEAYNAATFASMSFASPGRTRVFHPRARGNYSFLRVSSAVATTTGTITGATNATPIVITSIAHGLSIGQTVTVASVGGNTAANGTWVISAKAVDTFTLLGSAGNGAYTSGGTWSVPTGKWSLEGLGGRVTPSGLARHA